MKKYLNKNVYCGFAFLLSFVVWTVLLNFINVAAIGPNGSTVGFSSVNGWFHKLTGVNMTLYNITDWLGLVPIAVAFGFAILGLVQWIKRKNILKVDYSILALGVYYIIVIAVYLFFESVVINYRPVLINGYLEVSYPSSTTLLVTCVIPTAIMQFNTRIKNTALRRLVAILLAVFVAFMVIGRLISGVHWLSDIFGGALLSIGLVLIYKGVSL